MSKNLHFSILLISLLILIGSGFYYYGSITQDTTTVVDPTQNHTPQISSIPNPFSSGNMVIDSIPTQPTWETSSGKKVFYNTNWMGRTVIVDGKPIHYQFGSGNPIETDKSIDELMKMNRDCLNYSTKLCSEKTISLNGEFISVSKKEDGTFEDPERNPSRMTPEIEYLAYSFLSNPIIRQSSESCGEYFWISGPVIYQAISPHDDIAHVQLDNWWNPYYIDINKLIVINTETGRKELNLDPIWTLDTQIQLSLLQSGGIPRYPNTKLIVCLKKHNQLQLLQAHVASHSERLRKLWVGK